MAVDEATNNIHAVELTTNAVSDAQMVRPLLNTVKQPIAKLAGDGAYDQVKVYDLLIQREIQPLIPPRMNAAVWADKEGKQLIHPRNEALNQIDKVGLVDWKKQIGYHRRSLAETAMFRWKMIFGGRLSTRLLSHQKIEVQIKAYCLNRFTQLGLPKVEIKNSK